MELLNAVGSIASLIGLLATFYTLYKVTNLPAALKQQSRHKQFSDLTDRINGLPSKKSILAASTSREVEAHIKVLRIYDISRIPFRQRKLKSLLATLEAELSGKKSLPVVQLQLRFIRDELTIR